MLHLTILTGHTNGEKIGIPVNGGPKFLYHVKQHMSNSQQYLVVGLVGLVLWLVSGLAEFGTAVYRSAKNMLTGKCRYNVADVHAL